MKITGGKFKGRSLGVPKNIIRPTQDAVREAVFNIIGVSFLQNAAVLDLFCGSGALGIEALSRGASKAVFVDDKKNCLLFVKKNLEACGVKIDENVFVIKADVFKAVKSFNKKGQKFNLILIDPPYSKGLEQKCLQALGEYDILAANSLVVIEYFKKDVIDAGVENLAFLSTRHYGDTKISFFTKKQE